MLKIFIFILTILIVISFLGFCCCIGVILYLWGDHKEKVLNESDEGENE